MLLPRALLLLHVLLLAAALAPAPTSAQSITLRGRVVERGGGPVEDAEIVFGGRRTLSGDDGRFSIAGLEPGSGTLSVRAPGYAPRDVAVELRRDTSLLVELEPVPFELDTLRAEARRVTLKGKVSGSDTGEGLIDAEVWVEGKRTYTNVAGGFRVRRFPAGVPIRVEVRALEYLPEVRELEVSGDTSVAFVLEPDRVARRMMRQQVRRLADRAHPYGSVSKPALDRDVLSRFGNRTVLRLVQERWGAHYRPRCVIIDDVPSENPVDELDLYMAYEMERVEALFGGGMLRIYSREYVARMTAGDVKLRRPVYAETFPGKKPLCR